MAFVSGSSSDDIIIPTANGGSYRGGQGNDTYIIGKATVPSGSTIEIVDTEGVNTIQLADGLSIASTIFTPTAVQLTLSNGAKVQIAGANTFKYDIGANTVAGDTTGSLQQSFTDFATALGTTVPTSGQNVGGTFTVPDSSVVPNPTFSVSGAAAVAEGATASFTVSLSNRAPGVAYGVSVALAGTGGATAGTDFTNALTLDAASIAAGITLTAGVLTIPAAVAGTSVNVTLTTAVTADGLSPEAGEGLSVSLSGATGASAIVSASLGTKTTTITDVPVTFALTQSPSSVTEGGRIVYTVKASAPVAADTAVTFTVVPGSSSGTGDQGTNLTNLNDFAQGTFNPNVLILKAGTDSVTFSLDTIDDGVTELPETFKVTASVAGSATPFQIESTLLDGGGGGQIFNLTLNPDTIPGLLSTTGSTNTAGNDVVNGTNTTYSGLDIIDGGAGTNALNITDTVVIQNEPSATVTNIQSSTLRSSKGVGEAVAGVVTVPFNTSAWGGLTSLKVESVGDTPVGVAAAALVVANTTDVSVKTTNVGDDLISISGGKAVTVAATGNNGGTTTLSGAVGAVDVNVSGSYVDGFTTNMGTITVNGGTTISVMQSDGVTAAQDTAALTDPSNFSVFQGTVFINGSAATTAVTAKQDSFVAVGPGGPAGTIGTSLGSVQIKDATAAAPTATAGTIETVTLGSYLFGIVESNALKTLNLSGTAFDLQLTTGLTNPTNTTLALNLNGFTDGPVTNVNTITDATAPAGKGFTVLNVTTSGADSKISAINAVDVTTLTVAGTNALAVTSAAGMPNLDSITVSGGAGFTSNGAAGLPSVKSFVSTSTGKSSVTLDDTAVTVTGGDGAEAITYEAAIPATAKINLGAGNDSLKLFAATAGGASINAGTGTNTLIVGDGDFINGSVAYNNFQIADISAAGAGTLNFLNLPSATALQASAAYGATAATNAPAGMNLTLTNTSAALVTGAALSFALATDTASDAQTIFLTTTDKASLATAGKGDDTTAGITVSGYTANDIESLTIQTAVSNVDGGVGATAGKHTAADYVDVFTSITGSDLNTVTVTGGASVTLTDFTAAALTKLDASALTGKLTVNLDASANTVAIAVLGGSNKDTISFVGNTAVNNIVVGNGGADVITLAAAGTKETVRYASDTDSVLTLTDTTVPVVSPVVFDTATGFDVITNFTSLEDKIELSSNLGLATGDARSAIAGKGTIGDGAIADNAELAAILGALIGSGTNFFNDGTTNRATAQAIVDDAADFTLLFIDTNADGNFTNGTDQVIQLNGVATGIVVSDIQFG